MLGTPSPMVALLRTVFLGLVARALPAQAARRSAVADADSRSVAAYQSEAATLSGVQGRRRRRRRKDEDEVEEEEPIACSDVLVTTALSQATARMQEYMEHPECKFILADFNERDNFLTTLLNESRTCDEGCHNYLAADLDEVRAFEKVVEGCNGSVDEGKLANLAGATKSLRIVDEARMRCPPSRASVSLTDCLTKTCPPGRRFYSRNCNRGESNVKCEPYKEEFWTGRLWSVCGKGNLCPKGTTKIAQRPAGITGLFCEDKCRVRKR